MKAREVQFFDPVAGPHGGWPAGSDPDRAYLEAFAAHGSTALIANLRTRVLGLATGDRVLPVTVNDAEYGDAYVCLPHSAYALYAKAELGIVDAGPWAPALGVLADAAGAVMRAGRINRIVHVGNWMLSTNLHGGWRGEEIPAIREAVTVAFPDHLIAVRSLNPWSDPALCEAFRADGWRLLPARQVWVTDDLDRDWAPRRDTRRDLALFDRTSYRFDPLETLQPGDSERIALLYDLLYRGRYSSLNPAFTPAFVEMSHRSGFLQYAGLRGRDGVLDAVVGSLVRDGVLTTPVVGHDTARPQDCGLYRLASVLFARMAAERGARLNGSAGAADFKRNRGARAQVEYTAVWSRHLPAPRRALIAGLQGVLDKVAVPLMRERGL